MKCKKLKYDSGGKVNSILFGIIIFEDAFFITFKTANNEYRLAKSTVLLIEDTDRDFNMEGM